MSSPLYGTMDGRKNRGWRGWNSYLLVSLLLNLLILIWVSRMEVGKTSSYEREPTTLLLIQTVRDAEPQRLVTVRQLIGGIAEPIVVNHEDLKTEDEEEERREIERDPSLAVVETFDFRYDYDVPSIIVQPVLIEGRHDPVMPDSLSDSRWEGQVVLGLLIDARGRLVEIWVEESSGREDADRDALVCYSDTHWQPATVDGRPTICRLFVEIPYRQAYQRTRF